MVSTESFAIFAVLNLKTVIMRKIQFQVLLSVLLSILPMTISAQTRFMVMSDMHVLDKSLFDNGKALSDYTAEENKVVEYSQELFDKAVSQILDKATKPDFILIPGDMSKDGEKVSHDHVVTGLKKLEEAGIKVYVAPGNHDINNPDAMSFLGSSQTKVASISADEFKSEAYYGNFGYAEAIETNGLSYLAYPTDKIAILSLDSHKPDTSTEHHSEGGLTEETLKWAESMASKALASGRRVIGMMHHPIMEHFDGHAQLEPTYIANSGSEYPKLANVQKRLVAAGIAVMFTGHFHLQSIAKVDTPAGALYDVMTGSLCAYPFRMRNATINEKEISINSEDVTISTSGKSLAELGEERVESLTTNMFASLGEMMLPLMENMRLEFAEARWYKLVSWPGNSNEIREGTMKYMFNDFKRFVGDMAAGDEHLQDPQGNIKACTDGFENYFFSLFEGGDLVKKTMYKLIMDVVSNQDAFKFMDQLTKSLFNNFTGNESNVMTDNANTVFLNGEPKDVGIESIASDSADAPAYNLNGLRANANGEGFFIKDSKVMLRQK